MKFKVKNKKNHFVKLLLQILNQVSGMTLFILNGNTKENVIYLTKNFITNRLHVMETHFLLKN